MAFRPFQFREKKHFKIGKRAAKHFEELAALSTHSAGRRAAVKAGCKPIHFSLDGCPLSCCFSGSVATLRDTLSTIRSVGREGWELSYTPCLLMKPDLRLRLHATQAQPCFPAVSNAIALPGGNGIFTATPTERITHDFAKQSRVPNGGVAPIENPQKKRRYATPPRGAYRLFLLSSPPAVSVEQKAAWDLCGIFNFGKLPIPISAPIASKLPAFAQILPVKDCFQLLIFRFFLIDSLLSPPVYVFIAYRLVMTRLFFSLFCRFLLRF